MDSGGSSFRLTLEVVVADYAILAGDLDWIRGCRVVFLSQHLHFSWIGHDSVFC